MRSGVADSQIDRNKNAKMFIARNLYCYKVLVFRINYIIDVLFYWTIDM